MPTIWRYLLASYLKVLIFCTLAFIALLLTLRLEEIAHFATLGPQGIYILYFTFYQIPYILPIALPIAALISSVVLMKQLCKNHEMTALRASGLSLRNLLTPLLLASSLLAIFNFYVVSELATDSHLASSLVKNELRSINPLLLLSNKHIMKMKGIYFDTLGASRLGESASSSIIAIPNHQTERIDLIVAQNLQASPTDFNSNSLTLFKTLPTKGHALDQLLIQNIQETRTSLKDFAQMVQRKVWTLNNDHLKLSLLLCRLKEDREFLKASLFDGKPLSETKQVQRGIDRIYSEIARRFSVAFAVFSFTLLGASCGITIGRNQSLKRLLCVIFLAALYVTAYFSAKNIEHHLIAATLFYTVPHAIILGTSLLLLRKTSRGIE